MVEKNLTFHYPGISSGYLGIGVEEASLNSLFFQLIFSGQLDLDGAILFPQRIPKTGFFEELCSLETGRFRTLFSTKVSDLRDEFCDLVKDPKNPRRLINIAKALLRLGEVESLCSFELENSQLPIDGYFQLRFVKESAKANHLLSEGGKPDVSALENLVREAIAAKLPANPLLPLVSSFVALSFRFFNDKKVHCSVKFATDKLEELLSRTPKTFGERIAHSIAYRSLAMDYQRGKPYQQWALDQMVELLAEITPKTKAEAVVALDNKLTAYQTLSKWYRYNNELTKAEWHVRAMTEIDPFDSVGFSELGIYLSGQNRFIEALKAFQRAKDLGPPAVGMNHFFCGKTFLKLGDLKGAMTAFIKSIEMDPMALSPHLELIAIYRELESVSQVANISRQILSNPELSGQLEKKEYDEVVHDSKICVAL